MKIGKSKNGKKAIGIAMAAIVVASIFATFAPALGYYRPVPIPSTEEGIYYLSPCDSSVANYLDTTEVQLHVNSSMTVRGGAVNLTYNPICTDITAINKEISAL